METKLEKGHCGRYLWFDGVVVVDRGWRYMMESRDMPLDVVVCRLDGRCLCAMG